MNTVSENHLIQDSEILALCAGRTQGAADAPAGEYAGDGIPEPDAPKETDTDIIKRLAVLTPLEYDRNRRDIA